MNYSINNMKMICALVVVATHCNLFIDVNQFLRREFVNIIIRISVPFFICVTGYYVISKYQENKDYINKTIKKLIHIYIFWTVFYFLLLKLPLMTKKGNEISDIINQIVYAFFQSGMIEPLWYFPAIIIGLFIFEVLYRKNTLKYLWLVSIPCYILLIVSDTYYMKKVCDNFGEYFYLFYGNYSSLVCGSLGCALLYLTMGAQIAKDSMKNEKGLSYYLWSLAGIIAIFHLEVILSINSGYWIGERGSYFMLPFLIFYLMKLLSKFPNLIRSKFMEQNQYSAGIYFIHGLYCYIVKLLFKVIHIPLNSVFFTILVIILSWFSIKLIKNNNGYIGNVFKHYV